MTTPPRILACYDGSPPAEAALRACARLFPGAPVDVLCISEEGYLLVTAAAPAPVDSTTWNEIERRLAEQARAVAEEGARIGRRLGLESHAVARTSVETTWRAIVAEADAADYGLVVVGARGRSAIRTALLGGVSMGVVAHCSRPVLVVHAAQEPAASIDLDEADIATQLPSLGEQAPPR